MIKNTFKSLPIILGIVFFCQTAVLFLVLPVRADVVSAQMYRETPTQVIIEVVLAPPAPSSMIVEMRFPAGVIVERTNPAASKFNKNTNSLKWLFKDVHPGSLSLAVTTKQTFSIDKSPVIIRYRSRQDQTLIEITARTR